MTKSDVMNTMAEARKFIARADEVLKESKVNECLFIIGSPTTSALRRQSMELTRSLAALRRTPRG